MFTVQFDLFFAMKYSALIAGLQKVMGFFALGAFLCSAVLPKAQLIFNNRPFYRYGGHIELIRFKEYYRMPRGYERISFVFSTAFRDIFS